MSIRNRVAGVNILSAPCPVSIRVHRATFTHGALEFINT